MTALMDGYQLHVSHQTAMTLHHYCGTYPVTACAVAKAAGTFAGRDARQHLRLSAASTHADRASDPSQVRA